MARVRSLVHRDKNNAPGASSARRQKRLLAAKAFPVSALRDFGVFRLDPR
jgi:hypothetical protein